jgi:hypothetical protein
VRIPLLDHHRSGEVFRSNRIAAALLLASGLPCGAQAQSRAELDEIRKQIQEVKDAYETRLQALEQRLKEAEATAVEAQRQAAQAAPAAAPPAPEAGASATQGRGQITDNRFNPALSVILQGTYGDLTESPHDYVVTGFADAEKIDPGSRGFALGESEISFSANIDQLFYGNLLIGFHEDEVEVEEAFFQTLALGRGFNVKAGRFFSGIGYQNVLHPHAWDFYDAALVQRSFLAKNYGDDGLQLTWVAPLPVFLELGGELGAGRTLPGAFEEHTELVEVDRNKNGVGAYTLFARVGGDLGISNSYRLGASYVDASTGDESFALADFDTRTGLENASAETCSCTAWTWSGSGRRAATLRSATSRWWRSGCSSSATALSPSTCPAPPSPTTSSCASRAGTCRACSSSCRSGASACATTVWIRAPSAEARTKPTCRTWTTTRGGGRRWRTGIHRSSAASACSTTTTSRART